MSAAEFVPPSPSLTSLRTAAAGCQGCHLYTVGTQTVFGEGRASADVMLVGEQPGDQEDVAGRPFVGPAGKLLDRALEAAGIDCDAVYVTNAVKHFKWRRRRTASAASTRSRTRARSRRASRGWRRRSPCFAPAGRALGATAAQALLGKSFKVTQHRGEVFDLPPASRITATIHPSAILRSPGEENRAVEFDELVADLSVVARELAS